MSKVRRGAARIGNRPSEQGAGQERLLRQKLLGRSSRLVLHNGDKTAPKLQAPQHPATLCHHYCAYSSTQRSFTISADLGYLPAANGGRCRPQIGTFLTPSGGKSATANNDVNGGWFLKSPRNLQPRNYTTASYKFLSPPRLQSRSHPTASIILYILHQTTSHTPLHRTEE